MGCPYGAVHFLFITFFWELFVKSKTYYLRVMKWLLKLLGLYREKEDYPNEMKYLVVGLGNMGVEYDNTRHNIGFNVIDTLAAEHNVVFKQEHLGDVGKFRYKGRVIVLLKPSTYMNRSGKAVRYWAQKHKIQADNLIIVVDDLNLPFGVFRLRGKGSDGGHNGLKDIIEILGSQQFVRLRLGIGGNFSTGRQVDYVLGKWSDTENSQLPEIIDNASKIVKSFASIGLNRTMNAFNN